MSIGKIITAGIVVAGLGLILNAPQTATANILEKQESTASSIRYEASTAEYFEKVQPLSDFAQVSSEPSVTILMPNEVTPEPPAPPAPPPPPPPSQGELLVQHALNQIGVAQDCTALVENALRALGYSVGDLAPMGFGQYGYQVDPSQASAGDIMMRDGHVAIYLGNGRAVHGGFNGMTVESDIDASPYGYAVIVRL